MFILRQSATEKLTDACAAMHDDWALLGGGEFVNRCPELAEGCGRQGDIVVGPGVVEEVRDLAKRDFSCKLPQKVRTNLKTVASKDHFQFGSGDGRVCCH